MINQFAVDAQYIPDGPVDAWAAGLGSQLAARALCNTKRLSRRVANRIFEVHGLDGNGAPINPADRQAFARYRRDKQQFIQLCGMVVHGARIRAMTARDEYKQLTEIFSVENLRIACKLRELHSAEQKSPADISRLQSAINLAGKHCMAAWYMALDPSLRAELDLLGDGSELAGFMEGSTMNTATGSLLVRKISELAGVGGNDTDE